MRNLNLFIVLISHVTSTERGPRPQNTTEDNVIIDEDYQEFDVASTLMDIFQTQHNPSNFTFEPGDKIRVLSNIVKIELDDIHDETVHSAPMTHLNNAAAETDSACSRRIFIVPSYTYVILFLNILTSILTLTNLIASVYILFNDNTSKRNSVYFRAEQSCPHEHVSLTSSGE